MCEAALPPPPVNDSAETSCITTSCDPNTSSSSATSFAPFQLNLDSRLPAFRSSPSTSPVAPVPLTGLPATTGKVVFLLALSPTLPKIPLPCAGPPNPAPPRPGILATAVDPNPVTVAERLSDDAVGRAKVVPVPCAVDIRCNDPSSLAFPFPLTFSGVLSSSLGLSALTKPMLVFGRLGGSAASLSNA